MAKIKPYSKMCKVARQSIKIEQESMILCLLKSKHIFLIGKVLTKAD